jgi:uncharacterized membrane protein
LARVGWLLGRLLAGIVMLGWLLMIIGILMVFVIGGLIVLLRWLILLGAQRTSLNHYQIQKDQLEAKDKQIEARGREVQELHVLLQQTQAALPVPKEDHHSWWRRLWHH